MQQEKWHQQEEILVPGIQIPPSFRSRPPLGSYVGAPTIMVRTQGFSILAAAMVMRAIMARSAFRLLWTDAGLLCGERFKY